MFSCVSTLKAFQLHTQDIVIQNSKALSLLHSPLFHLPQALGLYFLGSTFSFKSSFQNNFGLRIFAKPVKWFLGFTTWCIIWSERQRNEHCDNVWYGYWFGAWGRTTLCVFAIPRDVEAPLQFCLLERSTALVMGTVKGKKDLPLSKFSQRQLE